MSRRTVLIGLDGATFRVLDPLMEAGVMPFLSRFVREGVRGPLASVIPPLTPPAWTSLATGRSPGHHGILDFFIKERESEHIRFASFDDVRCETIWSMADRHGVKVTTLNFPVMLPPPRLNGNVIGGWIPWRQLRLGCHPNSLFDRVKALPGMNVRELAMDMALEEKAIEGCRPEESVDWIEMHVRREEQWFRILEMLMQEEPSGLTAVLFDGVDKIQHMCWRVLDPDVDPETLSPLDSSIRDGCLRYFSRLDALLAKIEKLAGDDATIFMASDHGFGPQVETFFVNAWLQRQGFLAWADPEDRNEASSVLGLGQMARHVYTLDWDKTLAYAATPSSSGIHIVKAGKSGGRGVPDSEFETFRRRLIEALLEIPSRVAPEEKLVSRIWTREEAFRGPAMEQAPDLTLELRDGGLISILASEENVKPRPVPTGTHRPAGVFAARGSRVRRDTTVSGLSILDVAPMVLYSLSLPVPENLEGRVRDDVFEAGCLQQVPVRTEAPLEPVRTAGKGPVRTLDAESEAEVAARLKALGYL